MFFLFINYAHLLTQAHFLIIRLGIICFIIHRAIKKNLTVIKSCTSKPQEIYVPVALSKKCFMFIRFVFVLEGITKRKLKGLWETAVYSTAM